MTPHNYFIIGTGALLASFGIVFFLHSSLFTITPISSGDAKDVATMQEEKFVEVPLLTPGKIVTSDPVRHYSVDVLYPKVSLGGHPQLAKEANDVIGSFTHNAIDDFIKNVEARYSPSGPQDFESDYTMRYNALLLSPTIISLDFNYSEYIAGSAHPNNRARILNDDLRQHLLLSTIDLFASSTTALPFLSNYTRNALKGIMADQPKEIFEQQTIPGTLPTHENFQEVALTQKGLLVIFNPYQVAPYARGAILVPIPLSDLNGILSEPALESIRLATSNIIEATPENAKTEAAQ